MFLGGRVIAGGRGGDSAGAGASSDLVKRRQTEVDSVGCCNDLVKLGEFLAGTVETDLQSVDVAESVMLAGFGDSGDQVVADLEQAVSLGRVGSEQWAS